MVLAQLPGQAILVKEVPNPQKLGDSWITDMAELISPESEARLNKMISDLEASTSAEIAIVTVYNTQPSLTPKAFATELFNTWGIGKQGRNNGVLFLVSKDERRTEIETGSGLGQRLPDAKVKRILQRQVTPQFESGNFDAGIVNGTQALISAIEPNLWNFQNNSGKGISAALMLAATIFFGQRWINFKTSAKIPLVSVQEQTLPPSNRWQRWLFWNIRWLAGNQIFKPHLPTLQELKETYKPTPLDRWLITHRYPKMFPELSDKDSPTSWEVDIDQITDSLLSSSWLKVHHYPKQLTHDGLQLLLASIILGITVTSLLPRDSLALLGLMPVYPLLWLGYEMWECTRWARKLISQADADQVKNEIFGKIAILGSAVIAVFMLLGFLAPVLIIGTVVGIIGTCAGLVRYIRLKSLDALTFVCADCGSAMEKLPLSRLKYRLTKPQKVEMHLKSMVYEGWHCPKHGARKREHGLDSHLVSFMVTDSVIGYCTACDGWTVETASQIKRQATSALPGCKLINRHCLCCDRTTQTEELIPKKSASRRQGHRSHTVNFGHGGGYHSSASSSDGGSDGFGGGSSDGGGAGDSW